MQARFQRVPLAAICLVLSISPSSLLAQEESTETEQPAAEQPAAEQPAEAPAATNEQPAAEQPAAETPVDTAQPADTPAEPAPADAVTASDEVEELYVTGSRIKRIDLTTPAPVTVLSRQDLDASGLQSVGQILQNLPSQSNAVNIQTNNGGDGSTRVNIRGIGDERTLVLVNGRRFVPGGVGADNSVDLNTIPAEIIDRIEVLKDGASAIYGSDAIGGVVNIITKKNFSGLETSAYTGGTSNGGLLYTLGVTGGERTDKGGFLLSFQWYNQSDVLAGQRNLSRSDLDVTYQSGATITEGSTGVPEGRFGHAGASDTNVGNSTYQELRRRTDNAVDFFRDPEDGFRKYKTGGNSDIGAGDNYNYQPENYLLTPSKRLSLWAQGDYELNKHSRVYLEASYTNRKSEQLLAPEPFVTGNEGIMLSRDNVYNPFGRDFFDVRRRLTELGNRFFFQDTNTARAVLGMDGSFTDDGFFSTWTYDMNFGYGRTQGTASKRGNLIRDRLQAAIGPSFFDDDGNAVCGTREAPIADCVPLNLFGGAGSITQEQLAGLTYEGVARGLSDQTVFNVQSNGELFELWKRPVGIAIGYSFRREAGEFVPDPLTNSGNTTGNKQEKTGGGYRENAGFVELNVPVLAELPAVQLFEVQGAVRVFDFDSFGSDATYKLGGRWQIFEHLAARATYSTAFRAPSVTELFAGQADSFPDAEDPCSTFERQRTPTQQMNCSQDGLPDELNDDRTQLNTRVGGNPELQAEKANILTAGLVITPKGGKYIDGLSLTLDYFMVEVKNAIDAKGAEVVLNNCYNNSSRADCDMITRDAFGKILEISDLNTNIGGVDTAGVDFGLVYALPTDGGTFRFNFDGIILQKFDLTFANRTVKAKGVYDDEAVYPELRFNAGVSWGWEGLLAGFSTRFIGGIKECELNDCSETARAGWNDAVELGRTDPMNEDAVVDDPDTAADETAFPERSVSSNFVGDLYAGYSFSTALGYTSLQAGINNVFNSPPPKIFNGFLANSDANTYDYLGRWFYVGIRHAL